MNLINSYVSVSSKTELFGIMLLDKPKTMTKLYI